MRTIRNPILPGFNPDPSIVRVGDDFYIATSTFEWFPGVQIHHSRDLVNWELVSRPLDDPGALPLQGVRASAGVWAPCLSHDGERFYLIFSIVRTWTDRGNSEGPKDVHNFLTTAEDVRGPWSEPVYLNSSGFDPSLFHDDDGKKWLLNMEWDYREGHNHFSGILLQEYDPGAKRLVGPVYKIFTGTSIGLTEGPHLYKRNGWYYLIVAEGGTTYAHAVTCARSRSITGPYEVHPQNPILTSVREREGFDRAVAYGGDVRPYLAEGLQKAGHASMCPYTDDLWVLVHLCGRPLPGTLYCPLGRETALQAVRWGEDDWPHVEGGPHPQTEVRLPGDPVEKRGGAVFKDDFDGPGLRPEYQFLRMPLEGKYSLTERPGFVRLYGRESILSEFDQSLLARRVEHFRWRAQTAVEFSPTSFQHMAGLLVRYDESNQYYLRISADDGGRRVLGLLVYDRGLLSMPLGDDEVVLPDEGPVFLRVEMDLYDVRFSYSIDGVEWKEIGPVLPSWKLSDDYVVPLGFTGMFVGIACQDLRGTGVWADFDYFLYEALDG
ncbi:glycoside hydrolase family 43 [Spirochaeta thermophila DSM 6578]|uniref:Glycoside hydrolase family 43 n=1 Tax=Winmispira thermophila (strain ATCC 700085 / DSM 6578 / Z-1203) TaxID=869211 RepID=G0GD76_WINT7|nr:glycoside hydrolase family 43 protein [Spirochaeta thermophila]AEJ62151.1 glycoside hydrolase family 43 [Spirochaeta thermophila DSM 6578]